MNLLAVAAHPDDIETQGATLQHAALRGAAAGVGFAKGFREVKTYPRTGNLALLPGFGR